MIGRFSITNKVPKDLQLTLSGSAGDDLEEKEIRI